MLNIKKRVYASMSVFVVALMFLLMPQLASACGEDGSCGSGGITSEQGAAILQELKEIKLLLQRQHGGGGEQAVRMAPLELKGPVELPLKAGKQLGNKRAKLALVEFTDYQCPYCKRFFDTTWPALKKQYVDTGKVLFISRNLPLPFHPFAKPAAVAAACAADQGKYWQMREALFSSQPDLGSKTIKAVAKKLKLNQKRFDQCVASGKHDKAIDMDIKTASAIGIDGTPSFLLGRIEKGKVVGELVVGAQPLSAFAEKIDALLSK